MAYLYPWGNTQQLNLDWILQKIKDLEAGASAAVLDEISNALLAASYSAQAYEQFDIVFRDGKLYLANADIPAPGEAWTPAHWDEILLGGPVSALLKHVSNMSSDYVINDSQVTGDTISDALDTLKNAIDGISLDSDSVSNESQVTGDNVSDALDNLKGAISNVESKLPNVTLLNPSNIECAPNDSTTLATINITAGTWIFIGTHTWTQSSSAIYIDSIESTDTQALTIAITRNLSMASGGGASTVGVYNATAPQTIYYKTLQFDTVNRTTRYTRFMAIRISD